MAKAPIVFPTMVAALDMFLKDCKQIIIAGDPSAADTQYVS